MGEALDRLAEQIDQLRTRVPAGQSTTAWRLARTRLCEKGQFNQCDVELPPPLPTQEHVRRGLSSMVVNLIEQRKAGGAATADDYPYTLMELRAVSNMLNGNSGQGHLQVQLNQHQWGYEQCRKALSPKSLISDHGVG